MEAAARRRGVTVFFTGLSGSGKSTVARGLAERVESQDERTVSLLDGDEVRRLLSAGLGFSRADRDINIRRIGYVATEVTRHGGMAICAPIAPFAGRGRCGCGGGGGDASGAVPHAGRVRARDGRACTRVHGGLIPDFTGSLALRGADDAKWDGHATISVRKRRGGAGCAAKGDT